MTPPGNNRIAAVWYNSPTFTVDVGVTAGQSYTIELYALDFDDKQRSETIQLSNAGTGAVLNTENLSNFSGGVYMKWTITGNVLITFTQTGGSNAVVNGLFFDPPSAPPPPPPPASATFIGKDTTTEGSWIGVYGSLGYDIISGPSSNPTYATITPAEESTYTWSTTSNDPRALETVTPPGNNRVAAVWYNSPTFMVDVDVAAGQSYNLELYALDYDNNGVARRSSSATPTRARCWIPRACPISRPGST